MDAQSYREKLIRHGLPSIPHPSYPDMKVRSVRTVQEHVQLLIQKIYEESLEVSNAKTKDSLIGEYADMLEVADTLIYFSMHPEGKIYISLHLALYFYRNILESVRKAGIGEERIYEKKLQKLKEKGGFRIGVVWIY